MRLLADLGNSAACAHESRAMPERVARTRAVLELATRIGAEVVVAGSAPFSDDAASATPTPPVKLH